MAIKKEKRDNVSTNRLMLLFTIVNRKKADYYADLIQGFSANLQLTVLGEGTADKSMLSKLGLTDSEKAVIISVIREERQDEILRTVAERFKTIRDGKGIAYTVPFSSIIGAGVFNFLCDNRQTFT